MSVKYILYLDGISSRQYCLPTDRCYGSMHTDLVRGNLNWNCFIHIAIIFQHNIESHFSSCSCSSGRALFLLVDQRPSQNGPTSN